MLKTCGGECLKHCHAVIRWRAFVAKYCVSESWAGNQSAATSSGLLTQRELRQLGVHRDCFRLIGINRQIGVCLSSRPNLLVGVGLNRVHRAFDERDRKRLALLRPHLVEAYEHVCFKADLQEQLARQDLAFDELRLGLLSVDAMGRIVDENATAREALTEVFADRSGRSQFLPGEIHEWLRTVICDLDRVERSSAVRSTAEFAGPAGNLRVRLLVDDRRDLFTLLLRYDEPCDPVTRLHRNGLTRREAEVLHRLTLGEANKEIAAALGIGLGTTRIHVERVLGKLSVTSRTGAARVALGWLTEE